ncbi:hypothetical protein DPMN_085465 [Dreissena polymorpha]|uniref:Neurotransmitter-gated ion-channel transmembrane domain-containing protein n=2 Tax=Dreissena polymorpha TaxID=45954 RepID=A0A9D3YCS3_DREPO|nr:hypothetical protein DPMN_085465 [Dreissena polymorpha]
MIFVTWGYTASDVRIWRPELGQAANLEDILPNPEWDLVGVRTRNESNPRPMIIFDVYLKRKPTYVVNNIILPLIVLIALNGCVFLLPERSGEKTGFAVTVFLSFMVFAIIVQATLPVNSENVWYLSVFVTLQTVESSVITIVAICLVRIEGRSDRVPDWLASLIICITCYKVLSRSSDPTKDGCNLCLGKQKCENNKVEPFFIDECHEHESSLGDNREEAPIVDWGQVSSRLNWLFFAVFVVFNIVSLFILMALLYLNTRDQ